MEAKKVPIKFNVDDRGVLWQIFDSKNDKISFDGAEYLELPSIKRVYKVENFSKDTIRGMHFHKKEWKFFTVIRGSVKFVISPTENVTDKTKIFVLSCKKPEVLIVPPNNYNGWKSLEEDTVVLGLSNFSLEETLKDDFRILPTPFMKLFEVENR